MENEKMNFQRFKKEWKEAMVYNPDECDIEQEINDYYTEYKDSLSKYGKGMSVKEWCEFYFYDFNLDDNPYMLKEEALKTKHGDGLKKLANQFRSNNNLPQIPLTNGKRD